MHPSVPIKGNALFLASITPLLPFAPATPVSEFPAYPTSPSRPSCPSCLSRLRYKKLPRHLTISREHIIIYLRYS